MGKNINLDIDTLLNKEFNSELKGYSPIEVDRFLDLIIEDYNTFNGIIKELNDNVEFLEKSNDNLKLNVIDLESKLTAAREQAANREVNTASTLSQVDILRRLSKLEQEVYKK